MHALIMIAHGSRRDEANAEFIAVVEKVKAVAMSKFNVIEHCFLEMESPSLDDTVERVIKTGATRVSIFPYFLNSGNHVRQDIPAMIDRLMRDHPECRIQLLPYLGALDGIVELIGRHLPDPC